MAEIDVAVIGAGAAGIAAGRRLAASGLSFLLVEALDRIGGRAWTRTVDGIPLDLGCGWLHSADRNPWTSLAEDEGFTVDRTSPAWGTQFANLGFDSADQAAAAMACDSFERRLREQPPETDRAVDALDPAEKWNAAIEARSSYVNGVALACLSVSDYCAYAEADTGVNWRIAEGYGALIASAAHGLPVRLSTPVAMIDRSRDPLKIVTTAGTIAARTAIVTVPTTSLANGSLRIVPDHDEMREAANALPLGLADKLFLRLAHPGEIDPDSHMLGNPRRAETGSYYLRPFGHGIIECFFGGKAAAMLGREGEDAMVAFAIEELVDLFGSGIRRRLEPLAASGWGTVPSIRGSYSHALPRAAAMRGRLARPIEDRIFFAGEACSSVDFSTAHGAYRTGTSAATAVIAILGKNGGSSRDGENE